MKLIKYVIYGACSLSTIAALGQKKEIYLGAGTGLFSYQHITGNSGPKEPYYSMLNVNLNNPDLPGGVYANHPRGPESAFSFFMEAGIKKITKHNGLWNFEIGYERRASKKEINWIFNTANLVTYDAQGTAYLSNHLVYIGVSTGKRIPLPRSGHFIDLLAGIDVMRKIANAHEVSSAVMTSNGKTYQVDQTGKYQGGNDALDLRLQLKVQYVRAKWGVGIGYKAGFVNQEGGNGAFGRAGSPKSYSQFFQAGISYRVK